MSDLAAESGLEAVGTPFAEAVRLVLQLDEAAFTKVRAALSDLSVANSPGQLARAVAEQTELTRSDARAIVSAVAAMSAAAIESSPDSSDPERELAVTITSHELADLTPDESETAVERLALLMRSDAIHLVAKARRLNYAHDRVYQAGEVLSDLRPVFGGKNEIEPSGFLIWHTLRVHYSKSANPDDERRVVEFALDGRDLEKLRAQLDRAIQKHKALRSKLGDFSTVHVTLGDLKEADDD